MKFFLIGSFDFKTYNTGGQPVKSRELFWALSKEYGEKSISFIETPKWKRHPLSTFFKTILYSIRSDVIIMLPAHNGVKVFSKILVAIKKIFKKKIYYDVIGGWLNDLLLSDRKLSKRLSFFDCVFVETNTMKVGLDKLGIKCCVVPNFKNLTPVSIESLPKIDTPPFKMCIFSRITEKKGVEDAINAISLINKDKILFSLDCYGPIEDSFKDHFFDLLKISPNYINYKGCVSPSESVSVLKNYFALLFPTKFYTEGIPGTIIDSYFSGLPVISSKWLNFDDVIKEGITGMGYSFDNFNELVELLQKISKRPSLITNMRSDCINESHKYRPEFAIKQMKTFFDK